MKNYLNPNTRGIEFDEYSEFICTTCGRVHSYSKFNCTPWMCDCGNELTSTFGAEDLCEYYNDEIFNDDFEEDLPEDEDPDYLPNPNYWKIFGRRF